MIEATYADGSLRVHPKNKAAATALMGEHHDGDLILPRTAIADVTWKDASALVNGKLVVTTAAGARHQLHFRKKQSAGMRALYDALRA